MEWKLMFTTLSPNMFTIEISSAWFWFNYGLFSSFSIAWTPSTIQDDQSNQVHLRKKSSSWPDDGWRFEQWVIFLRRSAIAQQGSEKLWINCSPWTGVQQQDENCRRCL